MGDRVSCHSMSLDGPSLPPVNVEGNFLRFEKKSSGPLLAPDADPTRITVTLLLGDA